MPRESFVLVVDDDPMILDLVSTALEGAGFQVTTASDAWQEVIQAQGLKIGLVISDIQMPGAGTGVDAVKRLRSLPTVSPRLPVISITGMKLDEARRMTAELLEAEREWLPQFKGKKLRPTPVISIPKKVAPVEVPLDPALAIVHRFAILASQKTEKDRGKGAGKRK